jgi:GDP-D-mannose dehydratase
VDLEAIPKMEEEEFIENEDAIGNLRMLDVIRSIGLTRFYQAVNFRAL